MVAGNSGVFALQRKSCVFVIESLDVPLDQREILAIVLGVAARAFRARSLRDVVSRMQSLMRGKARGDFCVAAQALQSRLSTKLVAARAVRGPV